MFPRKEYKMDVSRIGIDVSKIGIDPFEIGIDISEIGIGVSEIRIDISEIGIYDVSFCLIEVFSHQLDFFYLRLCT